MGLQKESSEKFRRLIISQWYRCTLHATARPYTARLGKQQ